VKMIADVELEERSCASAFFCISLRQVVNFRLLWKDQFLKTTLNM